MTANFPITGFLRGGTTARAQIAVRALIGGALILGSATSLGCASQLDADRQACVECALRTGDPSNVPDARRRFSSWCAEGDARSCSALAVMYERGNGVTKNEGTAATLYGQACRAGVVRACVSLGRMMERGTAARPDRDGARTMYETACHLHVMDPQSGLEGCHELGRMLSDGGQNKRARAVLGKACKAGHALACDTLGVLVQEGRGSASNPKRARQLFHRACTRGHTASCARL